MVVGDGASRHFLKVKAGQLVALINKGELSGKLAKEILPKMFETGDAPSVIMEREGLKQISDTGALEKIVGLGFEFPDRPHMAGMTPPER